MDYQTGQHVDAIVMAWYKSCVDFDDRVLWRVELPGGHSAEYMVSTERLITGDYTVSLDADVLNWWTVILTLMLILVFVLWLPARRRLSC